MREELAAALKEIPDQEGEVRDALAKVDNEIGNFVRAIAGGIDASSVAEALKGAEAKRMNCATNLSGCRPRPSQRTLSCTPTRR